MGLKIGQNINFWPFLGFSSVFGRGTASWSQNNFFWSRPSFLVMTQFPGRDLVFWLQHNLLVATKFLESNLFFFSNLSGPKLLHFNSDLGV